MIISEAVDRRWSLGNLIDLYGKNCFQVARLRQLYSVGCLSHTGDVIPGVLEFRNVPMKRAVVGADFITSVDKADYFEEKVGVANNNLFYPGELHPAPKSAPTPIAV